MVDAALHQQMGELIASSRAIQEDIRRLEHKMQRSDDKSDESRAAMHRRLDDVVGTVGEVETAVAGLERDVKEMKPVTEDVKKWKIMGMTAIAIIGLGGAAMGVTFAEAIKRVLAAIFGRAI